MIILIVLKNGTVWFYFIVMYPKDANGLANSVDPDQTALRLHCLIKPICPNTWTDDLKY